MYRSAGGRLSLERSPGTKWTRSDGRALVSKSPASLMTSGRAKMVTCRRGYSWTSLWARAPVQPPRWQAEVKGDRSKAVATCWAVSLLRPCEALMNCRVASVLHLWGACGRGSGVHAAPSRTAQPRCVKAPQTGPSW